MKKKSIIICVVALLLAAAAVVIYLNVKEEATLGTYTSVASDKCDCQDSWFPHNQTPPPSEGDGSPFDASETTNCIFHQWSWQKFLWLTKPEANGKPLFLNQLTLIDNQMIPVTPQLGMPLVLTGIKQAGPGAVLNSNAKYNPEENVSNTVYYSIHVDKTLLEAAIAMEDSLKTGKIPYENLKTFPIGSLELKVSWVKASSIPKNELVNYFTTEAAIGNGDTNPTYKKETVALLGMHVVGVVKNHPEFIWASFEHKDLAPMYDWTNNNVTSEKEKLFYAKGTTTGINGIKWNSTTKAPMTADKVFTLYEYGIPRDSGNTFMKTSQNYKKSDYSTKNDNYENIKSINECVAAKLDDVWKNYFYNGSLWLDTDGMTPAKQAETIVSANIASAAPGALARGSVNMFNVTMETYTQTFQKNVHDINSGNLVNCFTCHQSQYYVDKKSHSPMYLSHIFEAYLAYKKDEPKNASAKNKRVKEIEQMKLNDFREIVLESSK